MVRFLLDRATAWPRFGTPEPHPMTSQWGAFGEANSLSVSSSPRSVWREAVEDGATNLRTEESMTTALDNANPVVRQRETNLRRSETGAQGTSASSPSSASVLSSGGPLLSTGKEHSVGGETLGNLVLEREPIDAIEVFEHIRDISDPEHPYSLEQLGVVSHGQINVNDEKGLIEVFFTPTVAHCSMATLIGLCIRTKIMRVLPSRFKVRIELSKGSHSTEEAVNKQLNDKERVLAALENPNLLQLVNKCLAPTEML